jgi:hypothetical protein
MSLFSPPFLSTTPRSGIKPDPRVKEGRQKKLFCRPQEEEAELSSGGHVFKTLAYYGIRYL